MNQFIAVINTCPDEESAQTIASVLVSDGLAACVNIFSGVTSMYQWEGEIETSHEHCLLIKTLEQHYPAIEKSILALHPYELPEIITVPITMGSDAYLSWITQSVNPTNNEV